MDAIMNLGELIHYYEEAQSGDIVWDPQRVIQIEDHAVAWLHYRGMRVDGTVYEGYQLECECKFTPGVGYRTDPKYGVVGIMGKHDRCIRKQAAQHLRYLEIRDMLFERAEDPWHFLQFEAAVIDLLQFRINDPSFWYGDEGHVPFFYIQHVAAIIDQYVGNLWQTARNMHDQKLITLNGGIISPYESD
jgi:hypothetical protein